MTQLSFLNLPEQLSLLYAARGYTWKLDGKEQIPTAEDIQLVLETAKETLDKEPGSMVQLEVGRLVLRREAGHYDVYVYFGELEDE